MTAPPHMIRHCIGRWGRVAACTILGSLLVNCSRGASQSRNAAAGLTIQIKGSDTMVNLVQAWAENYKKVEPSIEIEVSGGGSGVGIAALERGAIDIATASRNIKPDEAQKVIDNNGKVTREFIVAFDALAIYVNKNNPIESISFETLAKIFREDGTLTLWSQLGIRIPNDRHDKIIRISRQSSSGTYEFFREKVLHKKDFKLGSLDMNGSKEVVELISATPTAIGYSGMGYATDHIKMIAISKSDSAIAYVPNVANTISKKYPLARSLQMYTLGEPQGATKKFLDWVMSESGQRIVAENGFVPIQTAPDTTSTETPVQS
jgi:phosphate transport system substrate-binding protein